MSTPSETTRRTRRQSWWRRVTLRDVVFATLPPLLLVLYFIGASIRDTWTLSQYDDWWSRTAHVHRFGWFRVRAALDLPRALRLEHRLDAERTDASRLRLVVDQDAFNDLQRDVPGSGGRWLEGWLMRGSEAHPVDLRFRGDTSVHWTGEKKSLTIKTGKRDFYKGHRRLIVNLKEVLPQYLTSTLAADLGLMVPDTGLAPVYVNDRFYGLFRWIETPNESFLRRHGHMPGNVFRGDRAERGEYFKGLPRELFLNPALWDRVAFNDRPGSIGAAGLGRFLADLNGGTVEDHRRLMGWMDRDELARYVALLWIAGDPFHMSGVHNQLWYEEPASGTLHPIVWDLRLLDLGRPNLRYNRFLRALLRDPLVLAGALREVRGWLDDDRLWNLADERMRAAGERYADEIAYDRLRAGAIADVGHPDEVLARLRGNLDLLEEWTRDARVAAHVERVEPGLFLLDLEVRGRAPVELVALDLPDGTRLESLIADVDRDGRLDATVDRSLREVGSGAPQGVVLPSGADTSGIGLLPERLHYRLLLRTAGADAVPVPRLANALTGEPCAVEPWEAGSVVREAWTWHPWQLGDAAFPGAHWKPHSLPAVIMLSGEEHLTETLFVAEDKALSVAAGTVLRLEPDVSILARGTVHFAGTPEQPIRVEAAVAGSPWGAVALLGPGASGSRFEHAEFLGGGGALLERVEFKGMVDVHWAEDVAFRNCTFADNVRCDDGFNAVHAEVDLLDCSFRDVIGDAIDYDFSRGTIRGCTFEGVGNDALDLMSCSPTIAANRIQGAGDKGISVGEESAPLILDNEIEDCTIGIEVKDQSRPWIVRTRITGCETGVNAYLKNWRYGTGGWPLLVASWVSGNGVDLALDPRSRVTRVGSIVGPLDPERPAGASPPGELEARWLRRALGLVGSLGAVGPLDESFPDRGRVAERELPLESLHFVDDFESLSDGWVAGGRVTRLEKRDHDLVARVRFGEGRLARRVDWDLRDPDAEHVLVLELSAERAARVSVEVLAEDGGTGRPAIVAHCELAPASAAEPGDRALPGQPGEYTLVSLPLPPARVRALALALEASDAAVTRPASGEPRAAVLRLHRVEVVALPRGEEDPR